MLKKNHGLLTRPAVSAGCAAICDFVLLGTYDACAVPG